MLEMREMWLLLEQMKEMRHSKEGWLRIRMPVKDGARRAKLASEAEK
jgi:hypothetical protein